MNARRTWIVASFVMTVMGASGIADAKLLESVRIKGKVAVVVCSQAQQIDCGGFPGTLETDIFLSGEEFVTRSNTFPSEAINNVFATVREFNSCTGEFQASFGNRAQAARQSGVNSADLEATFPLFDFDFGTPAGSIQVDVHLEGFGPIIKTKTRDVFPFEGPEGTTIVVTTTFRGKTRAATAEGTVSLDGVPVACTLQDAELQDITQGQRTVEHR